MKVLNKHYPQYTIEVEPENELEALYEEGDIVEVCVDGEYRDFKIVKKLDDNHCLLSS